MDAPAGKAFGLARSARAAWSKSLSAKIRLGRDEDYERLADFVRGLAEAGVDYVALHPRFEGAEIQAARQMGFRGPLAAEMPLPIVGNGDIRLWTDYRRRLARRSPRES